MDANQRHAQAQDEVRQTSREDAPTGRRKKERGLKAGQSHVLVRDVSTVRCTRLLFVELANLDRLKEKMFNPFFTTKPPGEGTGLGLSLSYDIIVKQHAGSIEVDTQPGEFTEFKVILPRKAALSKAGAA